MTMTSWDEIRGKIKHAYNEIVSAYEKLESSVDKVKERRALNTAVKVALPFIPIAGPILSALYDNIGGGTKSEEDKAKQILEFLGLLEQQNEEQFSRIAEDLKSNCQAIIDAINENKITMNDLISKSSTEILEAVGNVKEDTRVIRGILENAYSQSSNDTSENRSKLLRHQEYTMHIIDKPNPIDQITLRHVYVENNAILVKTNTWDYEDSYFYYDSTKQWKVENFLANPGGPWYIVIGATFGIGKTSLSKYVTSTHASKYIQESDGIDSYISIFVPLKHKLKNIDDDKNSLDDVLSWVTSAKQTKILLVCDGLDEYGENVDVLIDYLTNKDKVFPKMKVIITTRLRAGLPQALQIEGSEDEYVRLLPFNESQVNQFFQKYHLSITANELKSYGMEEKEEIFKPLFCWMFVITYSRSDHEINLKYLDNINLKRTLVYQEFIHAIIHGKYRVTSSKYDLEKHYSEEKRVLRKIAALNQIYQDNLTKSIVIEGLKSFGMKYDDKTLNEILNPILTSYFYLRTKTNPDENIDFMHRSFREYLIAEHYIESILEDKPYQIDLGMPSPETMLFLDGLLELVKEQESLRKYNSRLVESFTEEARRKIESISELKGTIVKLAETHFKNEQVFFEEAYLKNVLRPALRYQNLWIHRWLSLYILNELEPNYKIDIEKFKELIQTTGNFIPNHLRKIERLDLSHSRIQGDFSGARFFGVNFSLSSFSGSFSTADFSGANLSSSDIAGADFNFTNFSGADLSKIELGGGSEPFARFIHANFGYAKLCDANIYYCIFTDADFHEADLSGANLSFSDFNGANLSKVLFNYKTRAQDIRLGSKKGDHITSPRRKRH